MLTGTPKFDVSSVPAVLQASRCCYNFSRWEDDRDVTITANQTVASRPTSNEKYFGRAYCLAHESHYGFPPLVRQAVEAARCLGF